jgi:hypothetical protein
VLPPPPPLSAQADGGRAQPDLWAPHQVRSGSVICWQPCHATCHASAQAPRCRGRGESTAAAASHRARLGGGGVARAAAAAARPPRPQGGSKTPARQPCCHLGRAGRPGAAGVRAREGAGGRRGRGRTADEKSDMRAAPLALPRFPRTRLQGLLVVRPREHAPNERTRASSWRGLTSFRSGRAASTPPANPCPRDAHRATLSYLSPGDVGRLRWQTHRRVESPWRAAHRRAGRARRCRRRDSTTPRRSLAWRQRPARRRTALRAPSSSSRPCLRRSGRQCTAAPRPATTPGAGAVRRPLRPARQGQDISTGLPASPPRGAQHWALA